MKKFAALLLFLSISAAHAESITVSPSGVVGVNGSAITPTSITMTSAAPPTTITINPSNQSTLGTFEINVNGYDYGVNGPADARWFMVTSILSPSTATSHVWEQLNSFAEYNGTGVATGEINLVHSYFQMDVGSSISGNVETFESSALNNGTIAGFNNYIGIFNNAAGTVTNGIIGAKFQLTNSNATVGAIAQYAAIDLEPMSGGGSLPTSYFGLRINDANAYTATLGNVSIGSLVVPTNALFIQGPGATSGTVPFLIKNSTPVNIFFVDDSGTVTIPVGTIKVGQGGGAGSIILGTAAGGSATLQPATGASTGTISIPNGVTSTLATLAAQTFTGTQTAPTFNATTGFSANGTAGVASKSCLINTANAVTGVTLTITEGLITGTTTC